MRDRAGTSWSVLALVGAVVEQVLLRSMDVEASISETYREWTAEHSGNVEDLRDLTYVPLMALGILNLAYVALLSVFDAPELLVLTVVWTVMLSGLVLIFVTLGVLASKAALLKTASRLKDRVTWREDVLVFGTFLIIVIGPVFASA